MLCIVMHGGWGERTYLNSDGKVQGFSAIEKKLIMSARFFVNKADNIYNFTDKPIHKLNTKELKAHGSSYKEKSQM